jgi:hypothetical protein
MALSYDVTLARVCKLCGQESEFERTGPGRPREHCYKCVPPGFKAVRLPHRVKLRRATPLMPRVPKSGWASIHQIAP